MTNTEYILAIAQCAAAIYAAGGREIAEATAVAQVIIDQAVSRAAERADNADYNPRHVPSIIPEKNTPAPGGP